MNGFLGELPVDVATDPKFKNYTPADWAMLFVSKYGGIDGEHHKAWVLDQVARILKGTPLVVVLARWENGQTEYRYWTGEPSAAYLEWRGRMLGGTNPDGSREYDYDEGIAP